MRNVYSFSTKRPVIVSHNPHVDFYNAMRKWTENARQHCSPEWRAALLRAELLATEAEMLEPEKAKVDWRSATRSVFSFLKK